MKIPEYRYPVVYVVRRHGKWLHTTTLTEGDILLSGRSQSGAAAASILATFCRMLNASTHATKLALLECKTFSFKRRA